MLVGQNGGTRAVPNDLQRVVGPQAHVYARPAVVVMLLLLLLIDELVLVSILAVGAVAGLVVVVLVVTAVPVCLVGGARSGGVGGVVVVGSISAQRRGSGSGSSSNSGSGIGISRRVCRSFHDLWHAGLPLGLRRCLVVMYDAVQALGAVHGAVVRVDAPHIPVQQEVWQQRQNEQHQRHRQHGA